MSESNLLQSLIALSKADAALARLKAERKRIEEELLARQNQLRKLESEERTRSIAVKEKRLKLQKEEKVLKEEQEKLVARRKALGTLGNYKLQQKGEAEIDHAAKQLHQREESLLAIIEEAENAEAALKTVTEQFATLKKVQEEQLGDAKATFLTFDERAKIEQAKRTELVKDIDAKTLNTYERIHERHPTDAVALIKEGSCSGCFLQVAPQLMVQIAKGNELVKCRGCGRILYVDPATTEKSGEE